MVAEAAEAEAAEAEVAEAEVAVVVAAEAAAGRPPRASRRRSSPSAQGTSVMRPPAATSVFPTALPDGNDLADVQVRPGRPRPAAGS